MPEPTSTGQDASAPYDASVTRSAPREAYMIAEIRREIFRCLEKRDLVQCMRISRYGVTEAVKALYHSVRYGDVQAILERECPRMDLYLGSIVEIDARTFFSPPPVILDKLEDSIPRIYPARDGLGPSLQFVLVKYHPDIVTLVVLPLKRQCCRLRKVYIGADYHHISGWDSWIVHFHDSPTSPPSSSGALCGHIELITHIQLHALSEPPHLTFEHGPADPPSENFPLSYRFDMEFQPISGNVVDAALMNRWLGALREGPLFGKLYKAIELQDIPFPMSTISSIYKRQFASGAERLESVRACDVLPWSLADFQSLSRIAARSLTELRLGDWWGDELEGDDLLVSFGDLPAIIKVVRNNLPNLRSFSLKLKGIAAAEQVCQPLLRSDTLRDGGTITSLLVVVSPNDIQLFNTIRCLSQLCTPSAEVRVAAGTSGGSRGQVQTTYLQFLRQQSASRRNFLATIDFATLGITHLSQVPDLNFHADERPKRAIEGRAKRWAEMISQGADTAIRTDIPLLEQRLANCKKASARLAANGKDWDHAQLLAAAEELAAEAEAARRAAEVIVGVDLDPLQEIRGYVDSLQATLHRSGVSQHF